MQILTVPCKLDPTPEDRSALAATVGAFGAACRTVVRDTPAGLTNEARLRAEVYRAVRTRHGLSANLAQGAIARVAANRKAARATRGIVAIYRDASVQYDERTFRLFGEVVRLTLNGGRRRIALALGAHQRAQRARHGGERRIRSAQRGEVYSQAPPPRLCSSIGLRTRSGATVAPSALTAAVNRTAPRARNRIGRRLKRKAGLSVR